MEAEQRKTFSEKINGFDVKVTYVQRTNTSLDEAGLKREIGLKRWTKISKTVVDRRKLEQLIDSGEIDPMVVGKHLTQTTTKPHLRVTEKVSDDA